jgi:hypothetical protein
MHRLTNIAEATPKQNQLLFRFTLALHACVEPVEVMEDLLKGETVRRTVSDDPLKPVSADLLANADELIREIVPLMPDITNGLIRSANPSPRPPPSRGGGEVAEVATFSFLAAQQPINDIDILFWAAA